MTGCPISQKHVLGNRSSLVAQGLPIYEIGKHYAVREDLSPKSRFIPHFPQADSGQLQGPTLIKKPMQRFKTLLVN